MRIAVPLGHTIHSGFWNLRTSGGIFDKNVEILGQNFQENFIFLNFETPSINALNYSSVNFEPIESILRPSLLFTRDPFSGQRSGALIYAV